MRVATLLGIALLFGSLDAAFGHVPDDKIEIGVLDEGGGNAADSTETGALVAVSMAAEEFGRYPGPLDVETLHAVNKADPSRDLATVRDWLDHEHLAVLVDVAPAGSPTDAALARLLASNRRLLVLAGPAIDAHGASCGRGVLRWGTSPSGRDRAIASGLAARGRHRIALIAADEPGSAALATDMPAAAAGSGLSVISTTILARGSRDARPAVLAARASGADAVVLLLDGDDLRTAIAAAASLGLSGGDRLAAPNATVTDVGAVGLTTASGLMLPGEFDRAANAASGHFARVFAGRGVDQEPDDEEADAYAAVLAVLHAIRRTDSIDAGAVEAAVLRDGADDPFDGHVAVRADGWAMRPIHLFEVRRPVEAGLDNVLLTSIAVLPASAFASPPCRTSVGAGGS